MKQRRYFFVRLTLTALTLLGNLFPILNLLISPNQTFAIDQTSTPATLVLGQDEFEYGGTNGGDVTRGLNRPYSVCITGDKLIIADTTNNRILIYNSIPTVNHSQPDLVLGQANLWVTDANRGQSDPDAGSIYQSSGVASDGSRLIVADTLNNRILIWNAWPTENDQDADLVLGQPDFVSNTANNGDLDAGSLSSPSGVVIVNNRLVVSDSGNSRVLIWSTFPTENNQDADLVLGQPDFATNDYNSGGLDAGSLYYPYGITSYNDTQLVLADYNNNRVLIWSTFPTENNQDADLVLGQANFTSNSGNAGGRDAGSLYNPRDVNVSAGRVAVTDRRNHRVLIWSTFPTENNQDADLVLGQPDFSSATANNGGLDAGSLYYPMGVSAGGTRILVGDWGNNRVLIWNTFPTENNQDADLVLGQPDFTTGISNYGAPGQSSVYGPRDLATDGTRLVVADASNHRVLIWNTLPTTNNQDADLVLGQPDFTTNSANYGGLDAGSLYQPYAVATDGTRLIVGDDMNNRVLIWTAWPTENNQDADLVLGQPGFSTNSANYGGLDAGSIYYPDGVATDGTHLVVVDTLNNRVLIWNTFPTENNQDADVVLGQTTFSTRSANAGGLDAGSLYYSLGVTTDGTHLVVTDQYNHRVLIWNTFPTENNQDADLVLGQPDFTTNSSNYGGLDAGSLYSPSRVLIDGVRLMVTDYYNSRVLIWNTWPTENNQDADVVIGQSDFESRTTNNGGRSAESLSYPCGIDLANDWLFVADSFNNRVLLYPTGPQNTSLAVGGAFHNSSDLSLVLGADDAKQMKVSQDSSFAGVDWSDFATSYPWTLTQEGSQSIYVKLRDWANYETTLSVSFTYDITRPISFSLLAPGHLARVSENRPTFAWTRSFPDDQVSGVERYKLELTCATGGGWSIPFVPPTGQGIQITDQYQLQYSGFNDGNDTNDTLSVTTRSHSSWGELDGQVCEGTNTWMVTACDHAGNERAESQTLVYDPHQTTTPTPTPTSTFFSNSQQATSSATRQRSVQVEIIDQQTTTEQDLTGEEGESQQVTLDENGQVLATLTVQVLDQNLAPVPHARVVLTSTPREGYTDDHGWVTFNHVEPGEHLLTFYYANQTGTQPVTVQPGTIEMKVTAKLELEQDHHWLIWGLGGVSVVFLLMIVVLIRRKKS